jgi:hypothetical protein
MRVPAIVCALCAWLPSLAAPVVVEPREVDDVFANPGMGWQTFHRFADEDKQLAGLPSASAYFRFYWNELEPAEGALDVAKLDGLLARARRAGQKLAFRVMCAGTTNAYLYVPAWLKEKGCKGHEYQYQGRGAKHWIPDMDDPIFRAAHDRLIKALGARYDGHPDLDLVDIGTVGHWGEWHMSGTDVPLPSAETRRAIIEVYVHAFPATPKVMLIGDAEGMRFAIASGCGWRADCLGDWGGFSKTWCHMRDFYPQQIERTEARDAWKVAPVAFESCWDMRKWKEEAWDIPGIFEFALAYHASYVNNKSAPLPEGSRPDVERFLRRLGYRLVLRRLAHEPTVRAGQPLAITMAGENIGVAPPYRPYVLAVRLTAAGGGASGGPPPTVVLTDRSIKGWLPGPATCAASCPTPRDLAPGRYELALAVVDPATRAPAVRLAIAGRADDGWYPLSHVEVTTP